MPHRAAICGLFGWFLLTGAAHAHVPDTSYARFKVGRDVFEAKFTYDMFTLARIAPGLDADGDRRVTPAELHAVVPAVYSYLGQHVRLEISGAADDFGEPQPVSFPPDQGEAISEANYHNATSLVHFVFRKRLAQPPDSFWTQFDVFAQLGQRHTILAAIEQDGQDHEVVFQSTEPDYFYDTGYQTPPSQATTVGAQSGASEPSENGAETSASRAATARSSDTDTPWRQTLKFFELGVEHIFLGYDHILFLLSLLVVSRFGELIKIVTSFTAAHTITLILATLGVVQLPSRFVESAIAATIIYVAVENLWVRDTRRRWILTFGCGLIHGFGFAGVLRELGLPTVGLVRSLVAFNVGVEVGQLLIVAALFPPIVALSRWRSGKHAQQIISGTCAICGAGWFVDRAFGLGWMPF